MKVSAINTNLYKNFLGIKQEKFLSNNFKVANTESPQPIYPMSIAFRGVPFSTGLRKLFKHGVPDMYSGLDMVDASLVDKYLKKNVFEGPILKSFHYIKEFAHCINPKRIQYQVYEILKRRQKETPDLSVSEIIRSIAPEHIKKLRKIQDPIFQSIQDEIRKLPDDVKYQFKLLMYESKERLDDKPVFIPFDSAEFLYRMQKIEKLLYSTRNMSGINAFYNLMHEAYKLKDETNPQTEAYQKRIMRYIDYKFKHSALKDNQQLATLIETSLSRLNHEKSLLPFGRQDFIKSLDLILRNSPERRVKKRIISIASKLPTSQYNLSAFVSKYRSHCSEKIVNSMLYPFFASVEHIKPFSKGGLNEMRNYGGASRIENAERSNMPFIQQMRRVPETPQNTQKYIDRIIDLYEEGYFKKYKVDPIYIEDYKETIKTESEGTLVLDISKFKKQ